MAAGLGRPAGSAGDAVTAGGFRVGPTEARSILWRRLSILAVAAIVVAVDQATKTWALHHAQTPIHVLWTLQLAVTFNSGTAFGLGQGSTAVIIGGVVVLVVVLLALGRRASRSATWPAVVAMGLLLGGAMGNLGDRLVRHNQGAVIDFIDLRWWPVFNVADASITVGAALLTLVLFRARPAALAGSSTDEGPRPGSVGSGPVGSGPVGPVGSGPVGSGPVGSGPVGSGPVGSGPVGSGPVGSGPVGSGPVGSGPDATSP